MGLTGALGADPETLPQNFRFSTLLREALFGRSVSEKSIRTRNLIIRQELPGSKRSSCPAVSCVPAFKTTYRPPLILPTVYLECRKPLRP